MSPYFPRRTLLFALLGLLIGSIAPAAHAQETGAIAGVVVDATNGESLPGANVSIKGTTTGTATDLNGRYRLDGLDPGTYDIVASFVGFARQTVTGVEVVAGETTEMDFTLQEESAQLEEVIVEAEVAQDSEAGLLKDRQRAAGVSDAISAELMSQSGASDAADAMKKVTGASVVGGKYVYVRGLGDRYSQTQLNGVSLPTADPDRNSVQFDLFSSSQLDNIVTQKTFTPDKPGSFTGGLIDIGTKNFPSDLTLSFSSSVSVNTDTHFDDSFLSYAGGDTDFLGFDDGTREIPDIVAEQDIPEVGQAVDAFFDGNPDDLQLLSDQSDAFSNAMGPTTRLAPVNQSYKFSLGNESDLFGRPLGYLLNVSYGRSASFYNDGFTGRYEPPIDNEGQQTLPKALQLDDTKGTEEAQVGAVANLNYNLTPNNSLSADILYSHVGTAEARFQTGPWPRANVPEFTNRTLSWNERRLYSIQTRGEHYLENVLGATVEWSASYADTRQDEPDTRFFANQRQVIGGEDILQTSAQGFANPRRIFRELEETSINTKLDISIPFRHWSDLKGELKFGGAYKTDERSFDETIFVLELRDEDQIPFAGDAESYFSDENTGIIRDEEGNVVNIGHMVQERSQSTGQYSGDRTIPAAYLMTDLPITKKLRVVTGARLEATDLEVASADTSAGVGRIDEVDILPALNVVYALRENMNIRAAATRTLARPTFREISPFSRLNGINLDFVIGNPELQRSLINNYDLRWEWFTRPGEILAVSGFYKYLQDPIEETLIGSTNGQQSFDNVDKATVLGAEFEVRMRLDRLSDALEYVTFGGNLSLTQSSVDISEQENPEGGERSLQGQSPYTVNADLSYNNPETGTSGGVFFNVFGERLSEVALFETPNVFEQPFTQMSVNVSQRLLSHWTVSVSVDNVLNDNFEQVQELEGETFVYQRYARGRTISLGLSYDL